MSTSQPSLNFYSQTYTRTRKPQPIRRYLTVDANLRIIKLIWKNIRHQSAMAQLIASAEKNYRSIQQFGITGAHIEVGRVAFDA